MLRAQHVLLNDLPWIPHPSLEGVETKFYRPTDDPPPDDLLIARVAVGGAIPWHVHEQQSEIAYVLSGTGWLLCAEDSQQNVNQKYELKAGAALIIPAGLWHRVENNSAEPLIIFALHTPKN